MTLSSSGQESEVTRLLRRALAERGPDPGLWSDLGIAYRQIDRMEPAIACFLEAERLDPHNPTWRLHTANALVESGDLESGLRRLEQLLADDPANPQAHWQRAYALLLQGRFAEAWPEFAWRWRWPSFPSRRLPTLQLPWDGRSPCRLLLLWSEQGLGDAVMLAGLIPEARSWLAERVAELALLVDGRLVGPLQRAWPDLTIHPWQADPQSLDWDQHLPLGDLAPHLLPSAASFQVAQAPWLKPDPARIATLAAALPPGAALRCGLSWRSEAATLGSRKSVPLKALAEAVALPGVQLVCLQYGAVNEELRALRQDTGIEVLGLAGLDLRDDLDGLASLISCCDLVITISNATAHISGALGQATWLLLHQVPYWPWRLEGPTSPWYPSLRLFRQGQAGDWREPLALLRAALLHRLQIAGNACSDNATAKP